MMNWIIGLNAINSLAKTLMTTTKNRTENNKHTSGSKDFSEVLRSQMNVQALSQKQAEEIVSRYDADQDKKISVKESGMTAQEFQQWDVDKDGYITAQEIQTLWSHRGSFPGMKS